MIQEKAMKNTMLQKKIILAELKYTLATNSLLLTDFFL